MTHYRITFRDRSGQTAREFDANGDREALHHAKTCVPTVTTGYEVWRDAGHAHSPLIFAEWYLPAVRQAK
jgi:hypothetical protein